MNIQGNDKVFILLLEKVKSLCHEENNEVCILLIEKAK